MLPPFTPDGVLPAGDYPLTLEELRASPLVTGEGVASPTWDSEWRRQVVDNLAILVRQLWQVGIDRIFVDGSFVEEKDHPNDIDGYFECDVRLFASGQLERALNALDPHKVWTWNLASRRPDPNSAKRQLPIAQRAPAPVPRRTLPALSRSTEWDPRPVRQRTAVPLCLPPLTPCVLAERNRADRQATKREHDACREEREQPERIWRKDER